MCIQLRTGYPNTKGVCTQMRPCLSASREKTHRPERNCIWRVHNHTAWVPHVQYQSRDRWFHHWHVFVVFCAGWWRGYISVECGVYNNRTFPLCRDGIHLVPSQRCTKKYVLYVVLGGEGACYSGSIIMSSGLHRTVYYASVNWSSAFQKRKELD